MTTSLATAAPMAGCWNRIGVAGDHSCDLLARHVHCRNCALYSGAAQRNLQRPVGAGYREQWAAELRQPPAGADVSDSSALTFRIGPEWLALPTAGVLSVAPQAAPHRLPHRSGGALLGIVNVAGQLTPAVSLAALLGIDEQAAPPADGRHSYPRLLVIACDGQPFALPVAELDGIVRYASAALTVPAATINQGLLRYLSGVLAHGALQVGLLDAALLGHQLARLLR